MALLRRAACVRLKLTSTVFFACSHLCVPSPPHPPPPGRRRHLPGLGVVEHLLLLRLELRLQVIRRRKRLPHQVARRACPISTG